MGKEGSPLSGISLHGNPQTKQRPCAHQSHSWNPQRTKAREAFQSFPHAEVGPRKLQAEPQQKLGLFPDLIAG